MLKFLLGTLFGAAVAVGYVKYEVELPAWLQLMSRLQGNLVSTMTEEELFDLSRDEDTRRRALQIYFSNRSADAVEIDRQAGHPFLAALYRARAAREAHQLKAMDVASGKVLAQPNLRTALERRYGVTDEASLRRAAQLDALDRFPFLKRWLAAEHDTLTLDNLENALDEVIRANRSAAQGNRP